MGKQDIHKVILELGYEAGLTETMSNLGKPMNLRQIKRARETLSAVRESGLERIPSVEAYLNQVEQMLEETSNTSS